MHNPLSPDEPPCSARRMTLTGCVQGIGLRPAVARLAAECGVNGCVANSLAGVEVTIEGRSDQIAEFERRLHSSLPDSAKLEQVLICDASPSFATRFVIEETISEVGPVRTPIPRDVAVCESCLTEVAESGNRREGYPFTSCTNCGPRFSIITAMPYERANTEMSRFALCPQCKAEFANSHDRRFHAQTNACPACGPHVWCADREGCLLAERKQAFAVAMNVLREGRILAVRGLGGYQLVCDATNQRAVERLRQRKRRPAKPFAVMVPSLKAAEELACVDGVARSTLTGASNPIVLLPAKPDNGLAAGVHPGLNTLGVMLATTPLHWLLLRDCGRPLVVTSGNVEGEPLETEIDAAEHGLRDVADLWLHHDRPIAVALDDSVVRIIAGRAVTLRLARGLAPLPLDVPSGSSVVAVGGHQKSAIAIANGAQSILGPHVGDLSGTTTRERYSQQWDHLRELYQPHPAIWVHDLHPDYFTTRWALTQSGHHIAVQHHHAHIVSGMIERGWLDRVVLGVAFDGTGYGPDQTIWGGEFLKATVSGFLRVAHVRTFQLAGGEAAIREPARVAIALLRQAIGLEEREKWLTREEQDFENRLRPLLKSEQLSPRTSSAGRLFDGVATLVLGVARADFDGQPAMLLEAISDPSETGSYSFSIRDGDPLELDWRPMIRELLADRAASVAPGCMALRFHRGLATAMAEICRRFADLPMVLSGGVFQNRLLVELFVECLGDHPQPLGLPGVIPPNDGGLAAGQLAVGLTANGDS